ncbi:REP-associated tyrosine transposase [Ovoidimarina sediminis]|uniref:REP-associated tyrosine transposase n=1 Tax=Ovoidimarina sediminis TaxID=3079856 RepID=UPI00290D7644|nr:transposase [Rhodophyticola sp. MJ-SS7]MDU8943456.1 transposase [Rhodophyticola sp. MJ-SS7]
MTDYRRARIPGGAYFFTVALEDRSQTTLVDHVDALRAVYAQTKAERPFRCDAFVVLPDHLHAVWTLPEGDADFSMRWRIIKARFSQAVSRRVGGFHRSASKRRKGELGIWQRRFWEHCIRDEADHQAHVRYCWLNPVKHGHAARAAEWPYSSIHRDIRAGRVDPEWTDLLAEGAFGE